MDRDNTIARLENIAKHAVHTAGEDTFILNLDDGLAIHEAIEALKAQLSHESTTSDLISRQAALDAVGKYASVWMEYTDAMSKDEIAQIAFNNAKSTMIRILKELPTIQPEPQWIPVSERLPEKGGEYLVSVHHTIGAISVFHPEKNTYVDDVAIMKYYGKFPSTVRAWMPLPEAYKPNNE